MTNRYGLVLLAVGAAIACRSKAPPPAPQPLKAPAPVASATPRTSAARTTISEATVTTFVERWRATQEASDFDAYRALYAPGFRGIKRSGSKTSQFDRSGWLKDRRLMFQRDVKVKVSNVRATSGERSSVVTFVQDWSSPRFRDVGMKRMELVLEKDGLHIINEEMLDSTSEKVTVKAPPPDTLALIWPLKGGFGAVLHHGEIETVGAVRKIQLSDSEYDVLYEKDVTEAATRPFAALRDRSLDLYSTTGVACSAKVKGFRAVGGFTAWDDTEPVEDTWKQIDPYLVAVVEPAGCVGQPLWARASDLPKPTLLARRDLTSAETDLAEKALRKTPGARETTAQYATFLAEQPAPDGDAGTPAPPKNWEKLEPNSWSAAAFTHPASGVTYVAAERMAGEGCGTFGGYAFGVFKVGTPDWLDLTGDGNPGLSIPERPFFGLVPEASVMLEPAGPIYFLVEGALLADTGSGFAPLVTIGRIRTTCGC